MMNWIKGLFEKYFKNKKKKNTEEDDHTNYPLY